jgi:hypothetical protein
MMTADKGDFFLKGYKNDKPIEFKFNGNTINIFTDLERQEEFETAKEKLNEIAETSTLTISGSGDKEAFLIIAVDIKNLLSIAVGKRVLFDRQRYWKVDICEFVERKMTKNDNEGKIIIPEFRLGKFLEETLPVWSNYSKSEKDNLCAIVNYLNQTSLDYIEDRILRTVQAWECYGHYFIEGTELSDELKELKTRIKETYKAWKKDFSYNDNNGELGNRLSISLDQEKLLLKLNKAIEQSGLLTDKINLNLRELKNLRDQVAHTGRISITGPDAYQFLKAGVKGLQLIILKKLGYSGLVYGEKDGWRTIDKIDIYFG